MDRTRVGLHFGKGEIRRVCQNVSASNQCLRIPPGEPNYEARGFYQFSEDSQIVSLFPHMHWRGKDMKYELVLPDGRRETLLNVPHYSFNWQRVYYPEKPIDAPKGSRLEMTAHFDNSAANPGNPDPTQWVKTGEQTNDEMGIGFFDFVSASRAEPAFFKPKEYLAEVLARHPADEAYVLNFAGGTLPAGAAAYLPRAGGMGALYLTAGLNFFSIDLRDVRWEGDKFTCTLFFGDDVPGAGTVAPDGTVTIDFSFSEQAKTDPRSAFGVRLMSHLTGEKRGGGEVAEAR
ncbi:hypothetical protein HYR69_04635 [Candidatus Sumerlaeota bacterium]|nr:hypothetical protein [Candidatus Sumerlaeota bacterium]